MGVITKVWYECPACKEQVPEEEIFIDCKQAVGMYGPIVLADFWCKCGFKLESNKIIDNSGNIPPKE